MGTRAGTRKPPRRKAVRKRKAVMPSVVTQAVHRHDSLGSLQPHIQPQTAHLIYADPPFNLGVDYADYHDRLAEHHYRRFAGEWVRTSLKYLRPDGWFVICSPPEWSWEYENMLRSAQLVCHDRVIWHRTFGAQSQDGGRLSKAYTDLLIYHLPVVGAPTVDNDVLPRWDRYRIPSARQLKYNDRRADPLGKIPGNVWEIPDDPNSDVWKVSMICGTFGERVGWCPAQQPLELLFRVLLGLTNVGHLVFDPFAGASTTAVACKLLRRGCVTFDTSKQYVAKGSGRLESVSDNDIRACRKRFGIS